MKDVFKSTWETGAASGGSVVVIARAKCGVKFPDYLVKCSSMSEAANTAAAVVAGTAAAEVVAVAKAMETLVVGAVAGSVGRGSSGRRK